MAPAPTGAAATDTANLVAAAASLGANGGRVEMQAGIYVINAQFAVPNKVVLRGKGRSATIIQAASTFPTNTPIVRLGQGTGLVFGCRVEECTIDANGVTGATCIYSTDANELSGVRQVIVTGYKAKGIHFDGASLCDIEVVESYPHSSGATHGIHIANSAGSVAIRRATVGVSATLSTAGVYVESSHVRLSDVHGEQAAEMIVFDNAQGLVESASGHSSVTDVVWIKNTSRAVVAVDVRANGATNIIKDDLQGITVPATVNGQQQLGIYSCSSEAYVGGRQVGASPRRIPVSVLTSADGNAGAWQYTQSSSCLFGGFYENSPANQNDSASYLIPLTAGTWEIEVIFAKNTDAGILTVTVDGTSAGTIDAYNASLTFNNRVTLSGVAVATPGVKTIRIQVTSKNASSAGYHGRLQHLALRQTA